MDKQNNGNILKIIIVILLVLVIGLISFIAYDMTISKENDMNTNTDCNNEEIVTEKDEILSLTTEELNEKLKYLNMIASDNSGSDILLFQDFSDMAFDFENEKIRLNKNLFDNNVIKNKIAILIGNVKEEVVDEDGYLELPVYVNYDEFSSIYEEVWQEKTDTSKVKDGKYYVYSIPSGVGVPHIQIKAKDIIKENDTYIIKTYVGTYVNDTNLNNAVYNYNNNYEGELRFKKSNNYYQIDSFIIKNI